MRPPAPTVRHCGLCGSTTDVQRHHLGGRRHAPYFTLLLCARHHEAVTAALLAAGVEMRPASEREERLSRARAAALVFLWFIDHAVE